ncbi:MAG TPA: cyclic pyranopterin monophosphate synthase MoaC [Solirubrobacteraceae bacterium]|jgi:molybdenum cofactor biosynthesis protein MoaC/molybdopterin converting factor subunit 1|nr:cyclic pyranopterin monophosphate synthase MoaC [Solirubrobacteraceae bacterium]
MSGAAAGEERNRMVIEVRLFAILRERAGCERLQLELDEGASVSEAMLALAEHGELGELLDRLPVRLAVNREYADEHTTLHAGDEVALIPPLSGGAAVDRARIHARVTDEPLSLESLARLVGDPLAGAIVLFQGVTREVDALDYEAYTEMATERLQQILHECAGAHGLRAAAAEHRIGEVPLGEPSVIVATSGAHRAEAFASAREAIDRIKAEAPIWKRELEGDGGRWVAGLPPPREGERRLTHLDEQGRARMIDVGGKQASERVARARARVRMSEATARAVQAGSGPKGEVLGVARLAGIQAAKRTANLIPLAHPLPLTFADVAVSVDVARGIVELNAEARTVARTGVEMEAMTACAVAALTVYDMVKGVERGVVIEEVVLLHKSGGRSDYDHEG